MSTRKYIGISDKYKLVYVYETNGVKIYRSNHGQYYDNEREAALSVDKNLIEDGKEPINILKRK